jgi:hypothetical protein
MFSFLFPGKKFFLPNSVTAMPPWQFTHLSPVNFKVFLYANMLSAGISTSLTK